MKLDKFDLALVNVACSERERARPMLQCLHFTKGRVEVADGFMLVERNLDLQEGEEKPEVLLNAKMIKQIKSGRRQEVILSIADGKAKVDYLKADGTGESVEFAPSVSFGSLNGTFPNADALWVTAEKKAQVAVSVNLLKKLLSTLPADGILRIGVTEPSAPIEFECSNMDRPIRGMLMPYFVDWSESKWHGKVEKELKKGEG